MLIGATTATVLVCILLVLSVRSPSIMASLPSWIGRSADVDAWWTILAIVGVLGFATLVYWWTHGLRESAYTYLSGAFLSAMTFVLAMPTYDACAGAEARFWTALTWTLSLFVGNVADPFGTDSCPGPMPLALQLARLTAILTTFLSLGVVVLSTLSAQHDRVRTKLARNITLMVGLNEHSVAFMEALSHNSNLGTTPILMESDRGNPLIDRVRRAGVRVLYGDPHDPDQIRRLLRRRTPRVERTILSAAYLLSPEASESTDIAQIVIAAGSAPRSDGAMPRVVVRVDDPRQAEEWRRRNVPDDSEVLTDTVGLTRVTAQEIVEMILSESPSALLVTGSSPLALSVVEEMIQHRREQQAEQVERAAQNDIIVVASDADLLLDDLVRRDAWRGRSVDREALPLAITHAPSVESLSAVMEQHRDVHVVFADAPSEDQDQLATRIALRYPRARILLHSGHPFGIARRAVLANLIPFGMTLMTTGRLGSGSLNATIPEDGWSRVARRMHEKFVSVSAVAEGEPLPPSRRPWDELSSFYRDSNLRQIATALRIAKDSGRTWLPNEALPRIRSPLTDDEFDYYARREHESWCNYLISHGWRRAVPGRPTDVNSLRHAMLVPWKELSDKDRAAVAAQLRVCFLHLEASGYTPFKQVPTVNWQRYRRKGLVTAVRRDSPWSWQAPSGARMWAKAGDWEVYEDGLAPWSVTNEDFVRTYERDEADQYRRVGIVRARQAVVGEEVISTEGVDAARAGDWVIEGDGGNNWIVPGDHFVTRYEIDS